MGKYKRLVAAVDFSEVSVAALKQACDLSREFDAELHVVHAVSYTTYELAESASVANIDELIQDELRQAEKKLSEFIDEHLSGDIQVEQHVSPGKPDSRINQVAEDIGADLIVLGTHGRTGLQHLLMGSVAESVLRGAKVPVMCIKG